MFIPLELQKHILSYLPSKQDVLQNKKGRCICWTTTNHRCKNKINYLKTLTCCVHNHLDVPELFAYMNMKNT